MYNFTNLKINLVFNENISISYILEILEGKRNLKPFKGTW